MSQEETKFLSSLGVLIWLSILGKKKKKEEIIFILLQTLYLTLRDLSFYSAFGVSFRSNQDEATTWALGKLLKGQNISKIKGVINQKEKEVRNSFLN